MVAVVWGGICCQCSPVSLCHPHTPRLLYSFEVVIKSCSEHCGRDQHNVPVGLQGQSLNMYYPLKYRGSTGVGGLSSKLIVPLGESLH